MVPFIEQEMKEKEKFKPLLNGCMVAIVIIMAGTGALSYLAFGESTKDIILQVSRCLNSILTPFNLIVTPF